MKSCWLLYWKRNSGWDLTIARTSRHKLRPWETTLKFKGQVTPYTTLIDFMLNFIVRTHKWIFIQSSFRWEGSKISLFIFVRIVWYRGAVAGWVMHWGWQSCKNENIAKLSRIVYGKCHANVQVLRRFSLLWMSAHVGTHVHRFLTKRRQVSDGCFHARLHENGQWRTRVYNPENRRANS